jgi:hypothetical protein
LRSRADIGRANRTSLLGFPLVHRLGQRALRLTARSNSPPERTGDSN